MDLNNLIKTMKESSSNGIIYYENGKRKEKKFSEVYVDVQRAASFLKKKSLKKGDRIGILGKNSYEWVVMDLTCVSCGYITVPLEPNHLVEVDELIIDYELSLVLTNLKSHFWKSQIITSFEEIMSHTEFDELKPTKYSGQDIFTFNFTSGTSGKPKPIALKKISFDHLVMESHRLFRFEKSDRFLVFLPLNVYLERCYIYSAILLGFNIILVSPELVFKALQTESPTIVIGVPYFFENIQQLFMAKMKERIIFYTWMKLHIALSKIGFDFPLKKGFFPFRKLWGGKMRYMLCGSAPIKRNVLNFYELMGQRIYEGYGMNEIGGMITLNHPEATKIGSVGKAFPNKKLTFDEHGQIIVESDFHGNSRYYKDQDNNNQTTYIDEKRVATGDVGHMDEEGFVYITGRIKDLIILSNGVKVHPAPLEEKIEEELQVKNCCVFGDNKPYLTALIVPNGNNESKQEIKLKLEELNINLPEDKKIRNLFISEESFSVENGLLTPAYKRNRKYLYQKYALEFEKLY